jgi:hypothetical protein
MIQESITLSTGTYLYLVTHLTCPARMTNTLVTEEFIHTYAMFAGIGTTEVNLLMTTFASES